MKIGIVGDIHFSEYSSILRTRGTKYSTRLENCIQSINWAETITSNCEQVVYLGDFFDKPTLNASEITAFSEIEWNNKPHKFLVGNHEMGINNLIFSSAHIFNSGINTVIDKPQSETIDNIELCYLPYILEIDRKSSINEYFSAQQSSRRIIFSHNDISGVQLGKFISKDGFSIDDIESNCDLFINGHLHNGSKLTDKIINVGNLTGQNFSENAFLYDHVILILDTNTLKCEVYSNPYAINFYKLSDISDIDKVKNAVITIATTEDKLNYVKQLISENINVLASRVIVEYNKNNNVITETLSIDHINEFRKFVLNEIGSSELVLEELDIING